MQDPSAGVAPQLLPYVHLISNHPYPRMQVLDDRQAVEFLLQATRIAREAAPFAWQIINPPVDGTIFLTWQPPRLGKAFASDGYLWADAESTYNLEVHGLQIEVLIHRSGFRPQQDQVTCHMRKRYHIINKLPSVQHEFEPTLWLTHYGPNDPQSRVPVSQLPVRPDQQQMMRERHYLQSQGQIPRKEFVLSDRLNWPTIPFPTGHGPGPQQQQMHPAAYAQQMRAPQQYYQQQAQTPTGPQAKRQKTAGAPPRMQGQPTPRVMPPELGVADEEETDNGDFMDNLTPRDISSIRFKQHHEWMEEIFSSVYGSGQIVPDDLQLGLAGDLADLTAGILEAPELFDSSIGLSASVALEMQNKPLNAPGPVQPPPPKQYKRLEGPARAEFQKRVDAYTEKGNADLKAMKAQHAKRLAEFKLHKTYALAERKLREAGVDSGFDGLDTVTKDIETRLGVALQPRAGVVCVQKGGLEEPDHGLKAVSNGKANGTALNGIDGSKSSLLASANATPGAMDSNGIPASTDVFGAPTGLSDDNGLDLLEGMDLDVNMDTVEVDKPAAEDEWVMVGSGEQQAAVQPQTSTDPQGPSAAANATSSTAAPGEAASTSQPPAQPPTSLLTPTAPQQSTISPLPLPTTTPTAQEDSTTATPITASGLEETSMFDDAVAAGGGLGDAVEDFSAFDSAGDALAEFTAGGDLDLEGLGDVVGGEGGEFEGAFGEGTADLGEGGA